MSELRRRLALPGSDWRLLFRAFSLSVFVRAALWLIPFRILHPLLRPRRAPSASAPGPAVERIAWAVQASARRIPDATCLTQALVAEALLRRAGHEAVLHLGVARGAEDAGLEAHAWVESGGSVVVGDGELDRFTRLPSPDRWHK